MFLRRWECNLCWQHSPAALADVSTHREELQERAATGSTVGASNDTAKNAVEVCQEQCSMLFLGWPKPL